MYAPSFFLALLAVLVVSTSAMPMSGHNAIHHLHKRAPALPKRAASSAHRKRTCKPKTSSAAASSVAPGTTKPVQSATKSGNEAIAHPTTVATSKAASTKAASSQTSSAADSTETSPAGVTSLIKALFPVSQPKSSFSTAAGSENKLPLSDATLRPLAAIKDLTHAYVQSPGDDSRLAMKAHYPKGSVALGHGSDGGISFYSPGPDSIDWTNAQEVTFGYSVLFPKGFDFNLGGKLFGLYGGVDADKARSCSGGRRDSTCWSVRLMFREDGQGELYTYIPYVDDFPANLNQCKIPHSDCKNAYGASIGRGLWTFTPGTWTSVSMRVRLNDKDQKNGEIEVFADGKSVISTSGLVISPDQAGRSLFRGMMFQTFFGGHEDEWRSPKDQDAYFSDFSVAVTKTL